MLNVLVVVSYIIYIYLNGIFFFVKYMELNGKIHEKLFNGIVNGDI